MFFHQCPHYMYSKANLCKCCIETYQVYLQWCRIAFLTVSITKCHTSFISFCLPHKFSLTGNGEAIRMDIKYSVKKCFSKWEICMKKKKPNILGSCLPTVWCNKIYWFDFSKKWQFWTKCSWITNSKICEWQLLICHKDSLFKNCHVNTVSKIGIFLTF